MSNRIVRNITSCLFVTSSGDKQHIRYEPRFNGMSVVLREVGREDIQDRINAFAPYTDLNYMLSRLKVGDTTVLNSRKPMFGDFTGIPSNAIDAVNLVQTAESRFLEMSAEDRQKYNNDFRVWLANMLHPVKSAGYSATADPVVSGSDSQNPLVKKE